MLLVQQYLQLHSFGDLVRDHGVYASFSKSGHKFSLNYDQIEAREADPLSQECRGLILARLDGLPIVGDKVARDAVVPGDTQVLAFPMKRFFNYGQGSAAQINWEDPNLVVLEKLDGTLCIVYFDKITQEWCVATRAVPEADLLMDNGIFTFRTLFEKALYDTCCLSFSEFTYQLNSNITYCFELTTPYNRIVVNYPNCRVTLLAARALHDLTEFNFDNLGGMGWVKYNDLNNEVKDHLHELDHDENDTLEALVQTPFNLAGVPTVKSYKYNSIDELINWVSSLNPMDHEGVVVRDGNFNRIKVKNAAYVAYSKVRDVLATSERNCLELILAEKDDDVISFLPEEIVKNLLKIKEGYRSWLKNQEDIYAEVYSEASAIMPGDKKTFAITLSKRKLTLQGAMFAIFDGKANNVKDYIMRQRKEGSWSNSFLDKVLEGIAKI